MLTLYHAPQSRSSRIMQMIHALGIEDRVEIRIVDIPRRDGSGRTDPDNPHPEGKVPLLVHDGVEIRETNAIMLYLSDMFPKPGFAPVVGDADRGAYLSWLFWYGNVMEPVLIHHAAALSHPILEVTFRGVPEMTARLTRALADGPFLMGESYTAADLLCASPYMWFGEDDLPRDALVAGWVARCSAVDAVAWAGAYDVARMAERAA